MDRETDRKSDIRVGIKKKCSFVEKAFKIIFNFNV